MGSQCALSFFSHPDASTFYLFVGFYYTLNQYGSWLRPVQLRCHYSTVKCIISLYETFQMWFPSLTNGGGSFPCNTDAIFIVFNNSFNFVMVFNFRDTYPCQEQSLVQRLRGFLTRKRHERHLLLLIFFKILETHTHLYNSCFFRDRLVFLLMKTEYY